MTSLSILIILFLSLGTFLLNSYLAGKYGRNMRIFLAVLNLTLGAVYFIFLRDSLWQIELIRSPDTLFLGKWLPVFAAGLAGVLYQTKQGSGKRAWIFLTALFAVSCMDIMIILCIPSPESRELRSSWVTIQSSYSTCSAAACASLLRLHDIEVSEAEMIRECYTTIRGTTTQGIWRGLMLKSGHKQPKIIFADTVDELTFPVLINVCLPDEYPADGIYSARWGWTPGVPHTVVVSSKTPEGLFVIGEPSIGEERWNREAFELLWDGYGIILE